MMRIAVGALLYEGNTFSLGSSSMEQFRAAYYFEGAEIIDALAGGEVEVSGALDVLRTANAGIVPLIATHGGCGGAVTAACFSELSDKLISPLGTEKLDGIYLALHGAMVCEGEPHPEVAILKRIRQRVGNVPIVVSLDLHAHITPDLIDCCDAIIGYQHYPHDDAYETGVRAAQVLLRILAAPQRIVTHYKKLALLVSPTVASTRRATAMRSIYKLCRALEALPGVMCISAFPSTPWAERDDGGTAFVVVAEKETDVGPMLEQLCEFTWSHRAELQAQPVSLEEALERCRHIDGSPIVLSEMSDAVGAGACGDSALVLGEMLQAGITDSFLVQVVDPAAVRAAIAAGQGKRLTLEVGNHVEHRFGPPVTMAVEVISLHDGRFTYRGGIMSGINASVGASAVVRSGAATVLLTSLPAYEYADEQYLAMGLDLRKFRYVVVKNPMNYQQNYAWAPAAFALDTPGAGRADLAKLEWRMCARPFYPLDDQEEPIYRN